MGKNFITGALASALVIGFTAQTHAGQTILFDPDGPGPIAPLEVDAFDWLPGNGLAKGILPLPLQPATKDFQYLIQGSLANFTRNAVAVNAGGLGSTYEYTMVAGFRESGSSYGGGLSMLFLSPASSTSPNYVEVYFDSGASNRANPLQGTGYTEGTLVFRGTVVDAFSTLSSTGNQVLFDQFLADNFSGKLTIPTSGGDTLTVQIDYYNPDFFVGTPPVSVSLFNSSQILPFKQTEPSKQFVDGPASAGHPLYTPNLGAVNGMTGPDFQLQVDGNMSFTLATASASIGDLVWEDKNGNGIQDLGETGIPGVTVQLLDCAGNIIATTTTDPNGLYLFPNLVSGDYKIQVTAPAGAIFTQQGMGSDDQSDSDADSSGMMDCTNLSAGETDRSWDAGLYLPASLGDFVWHDMNANGIQDGGEAGISGVSVSLFTCGDAAMGSTTTNASGLYQFTNLAPGCYYVTFATPAGLTASPANQGGDDALDSDAVSGKTGNYNLVSGENNPTVDAGFYKMITIGDTVWVDANGNGSQDGGETGKSGVIVELLDCAGTVFATTTTDANGTYGFTVPAGDYQVRFVLPSGYSFTTANVGNDATDSDANQSTGVVPCATYVSSTDTVDAGIYQPASLGDFVWHDMNANGIQDGGEAGISGVSVSLFTCGDAAMGSTTTNASGLYQFTNLAPGCYYVTFATPAGFTASPANQGGDDALDSDAVSGKTGNYNLVSGENNPTVDAGFYNKITIGDTVWIDANGNGSQDGGETGKSGVTVELLDCSGTVIATTTTDANGKYGFTVPAGDYQVRFVLPSGYSFTTANVGNDATDSDANQATGVVPCATYATDNDTVDAGLYQPASLGDFVWHDTNANGIQDGGEAGISGVNVSLFTCGDAAMGSTTTNASGLYQFTNLAPGCYYVTFATPAGFTASPANQGGDDALDSDAVSGKTGNYNLVSGENNPTVDAGFYNKITIGDTVWIDANGNGSQDGGETGKSGVTVQLLDCSGTVIATTTTDANGKYGFTVPAGDYQVRFVLPSGYAFTTANVGNDATDSDANQATGVVPCATYLTSTDTVDAGIYQPASLGDFVWEDMNFNGQQDTGEPGIAGVTVKLYNCTTSALVTITTTDASGLYLFSGLMPGSYKVEFVKPTGYSFTLADVGNDATDSDANTSTGMSGCYTLISGQSELTVDAGLYKAATGCTYTQGYWKNHEDKWPVSSLSLGTVVYNKAQLLDIFHTPVGGNGLISLAHQLIAAKLNIANGASAPASVLDAISMADLMINGLVVPPIGTGYLDPTLTSPLASTLDAYNNGMAPGGPAHCDDKPPTCTGSIGDFVWYDANANGIQDSGETGINGVTVSLTGTDVYGKTVTTSFLTMSNGTYSFLNLCAGTYKVTSTTPSGYMVTTPVSANGNDGNATDSNNPAGTTVTLANDAATNPTLDFGFIKVSTSIDVEKYVSVDGGVTWADADNPTGSDVPVADTCTDASSSTCGQCAGGVTSLTLRYDGKDSQSLSIKDKNGLVLFSGPVTTGQEITFAGKAASNTMTSEIALYVNSKYHASIKTGCSEPIGPGLVRGNFAVIAGKSLGGGELCGVVCKAIEPSPCKPCSGKGSELTLEYQGSDGYVRILDKDNREIYPKTYMKKGQKCTIKGKDSFGTLTDEVKVYVNGSYHCSFDTSSSTPIGPGHIKGKFKVVSGKSHEGGELCPVSGDGSGYEKPGDICTYVPPVPACTPGKVNFKIVVKNTSNVTLSGITLTDTPIGLGTCTVPTTLAPGATYTCLVGPLDAQSGTNTNTAKVTGTYNGTTVSDTDSATYKGQTQQCGLDITKTADRTSIPQPGFDGGSCYDREGYDKDGCDKDGYDKDGYDKDGFNRYGKCRKGHTKAYHESYGYDSDGYDKDGCDKEGYDRKGFDRRGYDKEGYDREGYDKDGKCRDGHSKSYHQYHGYNSYGYDLDGYNRYGYDKYGYDRQGYDKNGCDKDGYDRHGWKDGHDHYGHKKDDDHDHEGCKPPTESCPADNKVTYTYTVSNNGASLTNVVVTDDKLGYIGTIPVLETGKSVTLTKNACITTTTTNIATATVDGWAECKATDEFTVEGSCVDGHAHDHYDRDGYDCRGFDHDGYSKDGYDRDGYDHDGYSKDDGDCRDGYHHD